MINGLSRVQQKKLNPNKFNWKDLKVNRDKLKFTLKIKKSAKFKSWNFLTR